MDVKETIGTIIQSAFSASFLIAGSDGEISSEEVDDIIDSIKQLTNVELSADTVWKLIENVSTWDEDDHLNRIAKGAQLPEPFREGIYVMAMSVAAADGEISKEEEARLPQIRKLLNLE